MQGHKTLINTKHYMTRTGSAPDNNTNATQQTLTPHWKQLKQMPHGGGAYIYTVIVDRSEEV